MVGGTYSLANAPGESELNGMALYLVDLARMIGTMERLESVECIREFSDAVLQSRRTDIILIQSSLFNLINSTEQPWIDAAGKGWVRMRMEGAVSGVSSGRCVLPLDSRWWRERAGMGTSFPFGHDNTN
jgi:hypothetical protein